LLQAVNDWAVGYSGANRLPAGISGLLTLYPKKQTLAFPMSEEDHISVLFIDSHDIDRNYYGDRLKIYSSDYVVFQAANGQAGISLCETVVIDCVVLEIDLADMSGFEVLVQLVPTRPPKVPIIVLTHLTNPFLLELAVKNGAVAALCKNTTSGDVLDKTILRAVSRVPLDRKKETPRTSVTQFLFP
jgi:DNA-binding NarL/FixJ family response regulator